MGSDVPRGAGVFPKTGWSTVGQAAGDDEAARGALDRLLRRYVRPLRCHLVLSMGIPSDQADDLVQGFITDKIIAGRLLAAADRERGRFRALLKTALENYVRSAERRSSARRRRPETGTPVSLSDCDDPPAAPVSLADTFEVAWAREVLAEALRRTEVHYREGDREKVWLAFEHRAVNPALHGEEPLSCAELASRLGLGSAQAVSRIASSSERASQNKRKRAPLSPWSALGLPIPHTFRITTDRLWAATWIRYLFLIGTSPRSQRRRTRAKPHRLPAGAHCPGLTEG